MADKIEIAGTFKGTVSFVRFWRLDNEKKTPYIEYVCTDSESGRVAYGKLWGSKDGLHGKRGDYGTIEKLAALGVTGDNDIEAIKNAESSLIDVECMFDTVESNGYINADNPRPVGASSPSIGGRGMDADSFIDLVFGADATAPSKGGDEDTGCPF